MFARSQTVDRFNKTSVSALVAPSNSTLMVLHSEGKPSDDNIKHFLFDVSDLYMKARFSSYVHIAAVPASAPQTWRAAMQHERHFS